MSDFHRLLVELADEETLRNTQISWLGRLGATVDANGSSFVLTMADSKTLARVESFLESANLKAGKEPV